MSGALVWLLVCKLCTLWVKFSLSHSLTHSCTLDSESGLWWPEEDRVWTIRGEIESEIHFWAGWCLLPPLAGMWAALLPLPLLLIQIYKWKGPAVNGLQSTEFSYRWRTQMKANWTACVCVLVVCVHDFIEYKESDCGQIAHRKDNANCGLRRASKKDIKNCEFYQNGEWSRVWLVK